jgi:DNA-directed RNA polymerase subunit RPC12/RpoP
MKFLCVSCDEGMQLEATRGPQEGSLQATFVCPRCRHKIVMLTNPWETQLVQTMGVRIGGRAASASPYEQVLNNLVRPPQDSPPPTGDEPTSAACPFAGMLGPAEEAGSAMGMPWTEGAKVRVGRIPSFIRPMVQKAVERYATEQGYPVITDAVMDEARSRLGM